MTDEHADGIGGQSHWLFKEIESMKFWAVAGAAKALVHATHQGVDATQGLKWLIEALTPERIWEHYLKYQEYEMEDQVAEAVSDTIVVRKAKGKVWHRVFDDSYTFCALEHDDGWIRQELPVEKVCEKCQPEPLVLDDGTVIDYNLDRNDSRLRMRIANKRLIRALEKRRAAGDPTA